MEFFKKRFNWIILLIVVALIIGACFLFGTGKKISNISEVGDSQIISILNKNADAKEYMQKYSDFKIEEKTLLDINSITTGQNAENFKEVYQGLELEDNRYIKINLVNSSGNAGLVAVIDYKNKTTLKAYGLMILKANSK